MRAVADPHSGLKRLLGAQLSAVVDANGLIARQAAALPPPFALATAP